eukprot:TRINITY_DN2890_c0_g1_i2.p1 TRINITY_DN2890_c0_g1~~TRINITY_DN2890_c0_g1_i2.p1  ORF type:complete len:107 (-),score=6.12 TRINITY_DN2890_c0_g1_i2:59-379(-)
MIVTIPTYGRYVKTTTIGLSLPVITIRDFHIINADATINPNDTACQNNGRPRMRLRLPIRESMDGEWLSLSTNMCLGRAVGGEKKKEKHKCKVAFFSYVVPPLPSF